MENNKSNNYKQFKTNITIPPSVKQISLSALSCLTPHPTPSVFFSTTVSSPTSNHHTKHQNLHN